MDIAIIIISAIGGIFVWNIFFSKDKIPQICKPMSPQVDLDRIRRSLLNTFGTTDIHTALKYAQTTSDTHPDVDRIRRSLLNTFGTTNLDFIFENYLSKENREKLQQQILQREKSRQHE